MNLINAGNSYIIIIYNNYNNIFYFFINKEKIN